MTIQQRPSQSIDIYETDFVRRGEIQQCLAVSRSLFLSLPGLRGFWPMAAYTDTGAAIDASSNGRTLTYNGNPTYNIDGLASYIDLDGTGDYLSRTDEAGLDITGTETYVPSALRGLTMGGWFYPTSSSGFPFLMSKSDTASSRSYGLYLTDSDSVTGRVSVNGTTLFDTTNNVASSVLNKWGFYVIRFTPSTEVMVRVVTSDFDDSELNTTSVPASIVNGTGPFNVGGNNGTFLYTGRASMVFICATALQNGVIETLLQNSRGVFGV